MTGKRDLTRAAGLGYVIIIVISNMLGSGVFKKIAPVAAELHSSCREYLSISSSEEKVPG
jgi:APA family basic amino acid/polyamine antiporter